MKCDGINWNVCPGICKLGHLDKMIMTATPFKPMSLPFMQTKMYRSTLLQGSVINKMVTFRQFKNKRRLNTKLQ